MKRFLSFLIWLAVALLGAGACAIIALRRGEPLNSGYLIVAALCTYALGYRFYSKWIAAKVLMLDDRRATPCEIHEDGRDFVKTNKWIVFGHHFAAISGPGPLVGPVLAAQFGYLPGTLWILIGVVLGGAVQDFIILAASLRRDGRSLAQMLRDELTSTVGRIGLAAILAIMIILLAVLALVVVKAMGESPWSIFTVGATIPIALFMGGYLRFLRVGKVLEVSGIGMLLLLLAVWGGKLVHESPAWSAALHFSELSVAIGIIAYGFLASVLPVWLLLAPRDYLSTFMKLGTILGLAVATLLTLPVLQMPALSKFVDGTGFVVPGKLFPFCFITIACGAISGFHTLIASGTTPKIIARESHARSVGYGAMCLESLVALMALIAACTLPPGEYLAINSAGTPEAIIARVNGSNFTALAADGAAWKSVPVAVTKGQMDTLAQQMGEQSLFGRTGGAPTFAVGMASLFARFTGGAGSDLWYHFALMFEALFILTTLDAGTRVGRYLLQDALSGLSPRFGDTKNLWAGIAASALIVAAWGFFLILGVLDPDGGVKALWPIFGIANQLLASIALCLGTTILLKMGIQRARPRLALVTLLPLCWLLAVTMTAGLQKIFHREDDPKRPVLGFLQGAEKAAEKMPGLEKALAEATGPKAHAAAASALKKNRTALFNNRMDAAVTATFLAFVAAIVGLSTREWFRLLNGTRAPTLSETAPVLLPADALGRPPGHALGALALGALLLKEVSGEAAIERERTAQVCACAKDPATPRRNVFLSATERQFRSPNRCC
ncbi:MAG: carbon starvation protein A [Chthoniobacter sp.]|nr:carbon starvation protein A [Chthoniobacter sp.]